MTDATPEALVSALATAPATAVRPSMNERAWRILLAMMRDGMVVPVVGARLLVEADGKIVAGALARQLLADYGVSIGQSRCRRFAS